MTTQNNLAVSYKHDRLGSVQVIGARAGDPPTASLVSPSRQVAEVRRFLARSCLRLTKSTGEMSWQLDERNAWSPGPEVPIPDRVLPG